jgi:carbon monoxide dehydrogenase subunit G
VEFENTFTVKAPVDEVYEALLDLERVTPAMPGAQVLEQTGEGAYKVAIKVKLGPVSMTYRGDVTIVERDEASHSAVLDVKAKEARGQGSASAKVRLSLEEQGQQTLGKMHADVQLSGKAAAMGRGVIEDVSKRLVATFASNLESMLGEPVPEAAAAEKQPSGSARSAAAPEAGEGEPAASAPAPKTAPDADALSVGPLAAGMAADRLKDPKVLAAVLGGAVFLAYLIGRRS